MWVFGHNSGVSVWKYFFLCISFFVGSPATWISGGGSFFLNIFIRVEIEDGPRKAKVESSWLG